MDKSKIEKEELKYEEKKAKQREKRRYQPNAGTGARGYGIFKRERLFPESKKQSSYLTMKSHLLNLDISLTSFD